MDTRPRKALAVAVPTGFSLPSRLPDLSDRRLQRKLSPSASKAFVRLIKAWSLKDEDSRQLLGGISAGLFYEIKRGDRKLLDQDQLTRISLLLGIYKALAILFPEKLAHAWPLRANDNPLFNGATPVSYMVSGGIPAMIFVRQLLDARRGVR